MLWTSYGITTGADSVDFGNNQKAIIVNSLTDVDSVKIAPHSVVLKTYNEVPDNSTILGSILIVVSGYYLTKLKNISS